MKLRNRTLLVWGVLWVASTSLFGQDRNPRLGPFIGKWLTSDKHGVVEIYDCDRTLCGRVIGLRQNRDANGMPSRDEYNPDPAARNRLICGSLVFKNLQWNEQRATWAGMLYDAENGKQYEGKLTVERPGEMKLRGSLVHLSWLSETVRWSPYEGELTEDCEMKQTDGLVASASAKAKIKSRK